MLTDWQQYNHQTFNTATLSGIKNCGILYSIGSSDYRIAIKVLLSNGHYIFSPILISILATKIFGIDPSFHESADCRR
jgi:hypothetical protein